MRIMITGGTVLSSTGAVQADVLVDGETIAALSAPGIAVLSSEADKVIDATGKYVLPGGIDGHTHMEMPFGGTSSHDTFETGTTAAAWGGTTTIIDFAVQAKGTTLQSTLDKWHSKADGNCAIDYGFHMIVSDVNDTSLKEMQTCIDQGVNSFKMFMAYPGVFYATDGEILRAMQRAANIGGLIMMHAENGIAIDELVAQALQEGRTDPVQHGLTRPSALEGEATSRAITLAKVTGSPLYIVHLSAAEALAAVAGARNTGQNVFAETCPQYLYLSIEDLAKPDFEGAKYVASPHCAPRNTRRRCGTGCVPTISRWCPRTTAPSASTSRKSSAAATSPRSRTGFPASSTGWTCCTKGWSPGRSRWPGGSRSPRRRLPGCSASTRARAPFPQGRTRTSWCMTRGRRRPFRSKHIT